MRDNNYVISTQNNQNTIPTNDIMFEDDDEPHQEEIDKYIEQYNVGCNNMLQEEKIKKIL